ncbi:M1 family metallopeptidase [Nocardioides sp.]|uniref:M1 family metallopeptidase n=1 Tax=Nocardioides sp. TaxID=35761 RepID=UPI002B277CC3|nr:M1 family aminopeptidase [Nocardioides sp.]
MKPTTTTRSGIAITIAGLVCSSLLLAPSPGTAAEPATPAVAGARTAGDTLFPHQGNGGYDVQHYDLAIAYARNGSIQATATIDAQATAEAPLSEFSLDLEGLTVSGVTVNGVAATYTRVTEPDTFKLVVTPATPVSGDFTTVVNYGGTPTSHTDPDGSTEGWTQTQSGGVVALNEPVGAMTWFPNNNTPRDKATFTTRLTVPFTPPEADEVPINQTAVSTGVLDEVTTTSSTRTFVWEQPNQQAPYLSLVAIGNYLTATSDVPLSVGTTPEWSYANAIISPISSFATGRAKLSPILKSLEARYGTYPGSSTGLVVDSSTLGYALETQDRPYFEFTVGQNTLIHELAHQWFGNAVSPSDWSDIWLNEGPATYLATQVEAELYGGDSTEVTYYDLWESTDEDDQFWDVPVAGFDDPADLFGAPTYDRGAMTLEAMRTALGTDVLDEIMATWIERFGGRDASTADWMELSEEISRQDLRLFFQDWLFDTDKPEWPSRWTLDLDVATTGDVASADEPLSMTLSTTNTGKVVQSGMLAKIDIEALLRQARLGDLPDGVTRMRNTLTWRIPDSALGKSASVTIPARTKLPLRSSEPIDIETYAATLGATCGTCLRTVEFAGPFVLFPTPVPTVDGTTRVGKRLTATVGDWADGATLDYEWRRDGDAIPGARSTRYRVRAADLGSRITFAVTGSKPDFIPVAMVSDPTRVVTQGRQARRKRPSINGRPKVGRTLRAVVPGRDSGTTTSYRWSAGKKVYRAQTKPRLQLRPKHQGRRLEVTATTTKPGFRSITKSSKPTKRIRRR